MSTSLYLPPIHAHITAGCEFFTSNSKERHTDEVRRQKILEGSRHGNEVQMIRTDVFDMDGKLLATYESRAAAAAAIGTAAINVCHAANSRTHICHGHIVMNHQDGVTQITPIRPFPRRSHRPTRCTRLVFSDGYTLDFDTRADAARALSINSTSLHDAIVHGRTIKGLCKAEYITPKKHIID